ncbi:MAG: lytic murein transglycosylase [bacterium]|nr:lytic murein transglycosylase [bacterium]
MFIIFGNLRNICAIVLVFSLCAFGLLAAQYRVHAETDEEKRSALQKNLDQLEQEAQQLDTFIGQTQQETRSLANAKKTLDGEIKRRELEIKRLKLSLNKTALEIGDRKVGIARLSKKIEKSRDGLSASILLLYNYGEENPLTILLKHANISSFFRSVDALDKVQTNIQTSLKNFRDDRIDLQKEEQDLEDSEVEQQDLKALQEVERRSLAQKQQEKDQLLKLTKGKEALFQQLLNSKQRDIAALKTQLFYLEKTGVTAESALRAADLAAKRAGIRTAFLLALLEVETGKQFEDGVISVGTNLGTGNWRRDLYQCYINLGKPKTAEAEKNAYFKITSSLGLNPDAMPVSRKPNYGCGGAMGPAQFLPTTWLGFSSSVAELTGHNPPSPWNTEDAFQAAAIFLARSGARSQTTAGEIAAAKTYISGSATCTKSICKYYSSRIIALAKEITRAL